MPEYIYVLSHDGRPLMPTTRRRHVKKLLNSGKARIASHTPFTSLIHPPLIEDGGILRYF